MNDRLPTSARAKSRLGAALVLLCLFPAEALADIGNQADAGSTVTEVLGANPVPNTVPRDDVDQMAANARAAFRLGTTLARDGHWSDAIAAFERSAELRPHAVTTYDIAYCERALGRYTRARKMFGKAVIDHKTRGGVELPETLITAADDYLAEVDAKIARVNVTLFPADAGLSVDGAPVEMFTSEAGQPLFAAGTRKAGAPEVVGSRRFELLLDPRPHKFLVVRAGYNEGQFERTVVAGGRGELELRLAQIPSGTEISLEHAASSNRVPAYVALGLGGTGVAVGIVAGLVAVNKSRQLSDLCREKQCYPGEGNATLEAARTAADISTTGFLVGAGGVAAGAALWWLMAPSKTEPRSSPPSRGVSAQIGLGSIAIARRF